MIDKIDHKLLAISRLATQYRESTNLQNYILSLLIESNTLEQVFCDLLNERWIDTAEGVQLDTLGEIVGQSRIFVDAELFDYFGFFDNPVAQSFGDLDDAGLGGRLLAVDESTTGFRELSDDEYRTFIRARIVKNKTKSTPEDIIGQIKFVFNAPVVIFNDGNTRYEVSIGKKLSLNEKSILNDTDIIPKTAGVNASYIAEFDSENFFSFGGVPGGSGFGDTNNSLLGGELAQLI